MKYVILLLLISTRAYGTITATDSTLYIADSSFTVQSSETMPSFVHITPVAVQIGDTALCNIIVIKEMKDYGNQPFADSTTQSGAVFFTIQSASGSKKYELSMSINNISVSRTYDAYSAYGWKFLYWKISEAYGLTITD